MKHTEKHTSCQHIFDKDTLANQWRKESVFNKWCRNNWINVWKVIEIYSYHTQKLIWMSLNYKTLNVKAKTIRLLGEKAGENLYSLRLFSFLRLNSKGIKCKITFEKLNFIKKQFCSSRDTIKKMKIQT